MSAYVVDKAHVDYLVRAGLAPNHYGPLRWLDPTVPPGERDYEPGAMMGGPTASETYEAKRRELNEATADRVGAMLWSENARSVSYRYDDESYDTIPGPCDFDELALAGYRYEGGRLSPSPLHPQVDPVAVLKACDGYEYQSCEHPGWESSEAHAFLDALRRRMIHALPGYDEADWSVRRG